MNRWGKRSVIGPRWILLSTLLIVPVELMANLSGAFRLAPGGEAVPLVISAEEAASVTRAAKDLAADIESVTGARPTMLEDWPEGKQSLIVAGQVGSGGAVDRLIAAGAFHGDELRGEWESFVIEVVDGKAVGTGRILVVAGSDPRGTIYGLYEIAKAIGVSPWNWWADVLVRKNPHASYPADRRRFGPPCVKYRGIFINDEDWGLHRWAARTFDPELGDIGPKTYARVFELLLRLRGNCLWPAMHAVSRPFNADRRNAELADAYGIVMSSSHAEPMLRNNVGEWTAPHEDYNYRTNREGVLAYWEERVRTNATFENVYTLGMRGIHDSGMQGADSIEERVELLERIIEDQRDLLREYVDAPVTEIPQIFVAYKEVLELYEAGLEIPEDVTIVWPDDNFGYMRNFASPEEKAKREGGFGVYYHISYLGRPLAYLWLNTTPPALIWEELKKSYAHGADRFWILNVGDLKPAEIGMDFFFDLAWDVEDTDIAELEAFLPTWAARTFDPAHAVEIGAVLKDYYRLNFQRKPEHLQFHLPGEESASSPWSDAEITARLNAFAALVKRVESLGGQLPSAARDAFFQLVAYPVKGSAAANLRYFWTERYRRQPSREASEKAWAADAELRELTRVYNREIAGGKWRHFMALEPADDSWRSMRIAPLELPPRPGTLDDVPAQFTPSEAAEKPVYEIAAAEFDENTPATAGEWRVIPGLGRTGGAVTILPFAGDAWPANKRPTLVYSVEVPAAGEYRLVLELLPTFPLESSGSLRVAIGVGEHSAETLELVRETGSREWAQGVLQGYLPLGAVIQLPAGRTALRVEAVDRGVVIDRLRLERL